MQQSPNACRTYGGGHGKSREDPFLSSEGYSERIVTVLLMGMNVTIRVHWK